MPYAEIVQTSSAVFSKVKSEVRSDCIDEEREHDGLMLCSCESMSKQDFNHEGNPGDNALASARPNTTFSVPSHLCAFRQPAFTPPASQATLGVFLGRWVRILSSPSGVADNVVRPP